MYKHILIPLDGSKLAETAIAHAEKLAKGCGTQDITLLAVVERTKGYRKVVDPSKPPEEQVSTEPVSRKERDARSYITRMAKKLSERGLAVHSKVVVGDPAQAIIYEAEHSPCDIIVMASHGRSGITRWALGSVADKVLRASTLPILMVGPREKVRGV
ncbi:MAG: universal stress protein [Dehalococcoidia bacterium]|nr:universal stress protein [Dehalococcoidia bacterium]